MKRYLGALAVAAAVFAVVLGSAAALDLGGGSVQVGQDNVKCDHDGVKVASYRVEASSEARPLSSGVRVTGIHGRCRGADIFAKVFHGDKQLAFGRTVIGGHTAIVRYAHGATVPAKKITRVQITIDG